MTSEQQPPVDDDEARLDDESGAAGRPEPVETASLEDTRAGHQDASPKRDNSFRDLIKAARLGR